MDNPDDRSGIIQSLMDLRYPNYDPSPWAQFRSRGSLVVGGGNYGEEAAAYQLRLEGMTASDLAAERVAAVQEAEIKKTAAERQRELQEAKMFFNKLGAEADVEHWARAAHWTLEEAVALSFGKDPRVVNAKSITPHAGISPFAKKYLERLDLARRAIIWEKLFDPVLPGIFIGWTQQMGYEFPKAIEDRMVACGGYVANWKQRHDELASAHDDYRAQAGRLFDKLNAQVDALEEENADLRAQLASPPERPQSERERQTLLKMIIAIAVKGYGYNPNSKKSTSPGEIAGDMDELGIPVSDDTVRAKLQEAADLLPQDALTRED